MPLESNFYKVMISENSTEQFLEVSLETPYACTVQEIVGVFKVEH